MTYVMWNEDAVMYVGQTMHAHNRFRAHMQDAFIRENITKIQVIKFGTEAETLAAEKKLILALKPAWNSCLKLLFARSVTPEP